jgi:hypothetical protein
LTVSQKKKNLIFFIGRWRPGIACFLLYFCPSLFFVVVVKDDDDHLAGNLKWAQINK